MQANSRQASEASDPSTIVHVATALALFLTIIGMPFGIQHLKLAVLALAPIGKKIVAK